MLSRDEAIKLLTKYNKEKFHIQHGLTVEGVMRWYADKLGYGDEKDFWGLVGLLHDVDFEEYPEIHTKKAPELLSEIEAPEEMVHAIQSHAYGTCSDVKPESEMEKVLFAVDELTGLIGAAALVRPSKSVKDMKRKSIKKKFKDKSFAQGCDRSIIKTGSDMLGWDLNDLLWNTVQAMASFEDDLYKEVSAICGEDCDPRV